MAEETCEKNGGSEMTTGPNRDQSAAEGRIRRKLDLHIMPLFFVLYMFAFLDRNNIGNARIAGMAQDLRLYGTRYEWLITIFYVSYIIFEFCLLFWKIFPPHIICATVVLAWGTIATVQAAAQSWRDMMAIRFLLGIFEAAYSPGIIYLLSFFYLRHEIGFRCGIFVSAAPLASTFAGALAYGITSGHSALATWRLLFLVEGLATLAMVPFAFYFTPDSPDTARFLDAQEKEVVKARILKQIGSERRRGDLNLREVALSLIDVPAWCNALMYFATNVSYSSLPAYLPTILKDMGYSNINAQGLSAPPYFVAFLCALSTTWIADRTQQRGFVVITTSCVGGIGYIILATVDKVAVRYFATFMAASGVFTTIPNILAWMLNNQGSDSRRGGGLVLIQVIGQCGPILGTRLYPNHEAPRYVKGMCVCAAFMFFTALVSVMLRLFLIWKNERLDRKFGKTTSSNEAMLGTENYGPHFRYVL